MITVSDILTRIRVGEPQVAQNLTVFPLIDDRPVATRCPAYSTLNQALADNVLRIEEISSQGSVPELKVQNFSSKPILLLDGEELVGSKQNRVPNVTILVAENATIVIPVSCVEAGRWAYTSNRFKSSKRAHFYSGRARKQASVGASLARAGTRSSDQGRVWADIDEMLLGTKTSSATRAMADAYNAHDRWIEKYVAGVQAQDKQVGAVFAIGGQIEGLELLARTATFSDLLPKLVRSFALDALRRTGEVYQRPTTAAAEVFLSQLTSQRWQTYDAVGAGREVRLTTPDLVASGLLHEDELVHLVAFRTPTQSERTEQPGISRSAERRGLMDRLLRRRRMH